MLYHASGRSCGLLLKTRSFPEDPVETSLPATGLPGHSRVVVGDEHDLSLRLSRSFHLRLRISPLRHDKRLSRTQQCQNTVIALILGL
jgi:hypothetical protein